MPMLRDCHDINFFIRMSIIYSVVFDSIIGWIGIYIQGDLARINFLSKKLEKSCIFFFDVVENSKMYHKVLYYTLLLAVLI
jgi:hypothetical protein